MECLGKAGLKIKRNKCEFGRKFLGYLGHQIGCGRVAGPEYRGYVGSDVISVHALHTTILSGSMVKS